MKTSGSVNAQVLWLLWLGPYAVSRRQLHQRVMTIADVRASVTAAMLRRRAEANVGREAFAAMRKPKISLYYGTVKTATGGQHFMAWSNSRKHALDMVEAALTATEPVLGSVVGPITSLPADVMEPGVFVQVAPVPKG